ncbi:SDR family NAD(P)-dependent oxidoreductase [Streptomyces coffeae]|uniref:SDR family oxidoreductase n=1 Tax=Streptomyces coffeae TaxID=621382 RepID=A0ABS1ND39_9ACTN|nr:SDR family oxidoreductase [Streptomyces coffeae]MBL1097983.1 SDR family oxidoreductase [Streptomyces coffeae]
MDLGLEGRTVLVTGATGAVGRAAARGFAEQGSRVALAYRHRREAAEELAAELAGPGGGRAFAVPYALEDSASPRWVVAAVEERWGGLDVLVANAWRWGERQGTGARFEEVSEQDWLPVVADNLTPAIRTVQCAVAGMRKRGWGRIALVSPHPALVAAHGREFHAVAKAGLHGLARGLTEGAAADGVLVNAVCAAPSAPAGEASTPEDIARVLLFLCSAANAAVTGETLTVAGAR